MRDSIYTVWRRQWQPTPVFLPGESQGWGSLVSCRLWGATELDTTEALSSSSIYAIRVVLGFIQILKDSQNTFDSTLGLWLRQKHTWKISPGLHNATKGFQR